MSEESKATRIEKLIASVKKAAQGDHSMRLDLTNKNDKLDTLAGVINELADALRERSASCRRQEELLLEKLFSLTNIFEKNPFAMWVADDRGTLIGLNQAYSTLMGLRDEDVKGKYNILQDNIIQEQGFLPLIQSVFHEGKTIQFTLKYDRSCLKSLPQPQTKLIFLAITAFPILDENGAIKNVVFISHDITERTLAQEDLHLTQFCVDHAGVGIFRIEEPEARIVSVNEQACRNLGYTKKELCSMTVLDIDPNFNLETWREHRKNIRDLSSGTIETLHRRKDGTIFPVEVTVTYFRYLGKELSFSFVRDITERKKAEVSLRESEEKYRSVVDNLCIAITLISPDMEILSVNKMTKERYPGVDFTKRPICFKAFNTPPREQPCSYCATIKTFADGKVHETITETPTITGTKNFRITTSPIKDDSGKVTAVIEMAEDITEKLRLEQEKEKLERQLLLAQKMEAVGTLAGGIAHDFNNMLSVILGYAELIKIKLSATDPSLHDIAEIENAALRSRDTTRQLLAFSRQQAIAPKPINLSYHINQLQKTLARLIGEDIELLVRTTKDLWLIEFDPAQIDQILVNLAVNARDAMPQDGKLTIEVENVILDEQYCQDHHGCGNSFPCL